MNKEAILELYDKYLEDIYTETFEKSKLTNEIVDVEELLFESFSDNQKKIYNKLIDLEEKRKELVNKDVFVFAYSLANKLLIASLKDDKVED